MAPCCRCCPFSTFILSYFPTPSRIAYHCFRRNFCTGHLPVLICHCNSIQPLLLSYYFRLVHYGTSSRQFVCSIVCSNLLGSVCLTPGYPLINTFEILSFLGSYYQLRFSSRPLLSQTALMSRRYGSHVVHVDVTWRVKRHSWVLTFQPTLFLLQNQRRTR